MADEQVVKVERGDGQLQLALELAKATEPSAIARAVAEWGADASEAEFANLALLDSERGVVRVVHATSLEADIANRWTEFSLDTPTPLGDAIASGEPVLLGSLEAYAGRYHGLIPDTREAGLQATASLPLLASDGHRMGAVGFAWREEQTFTPTLRTRLALIARLSAQALETLDGRSPADAMPSGSTVPIPDSSASEPTAEEYPYDDAAEIIAGWVIDFLEHESPGGPTLSLRDLFLRLDRYGWTLTRKQ